MRGLSDAKGSWKMICTSRRAARSASPSSCEQVAAVQQGLALDLGRPRSSCTMALPVVVLPQPDSPTRASVAAGTNSKDTSRTASKGRCRALQAAACGA
jgi:hypothetical protein